MYKIVTLTVGTVLLLPTGVLADEHGQGWSYSIGAGAIYAPTFLGDDDYEAQAVPNVRVTYGDRFEASLGGIRYNALSGGPWRAGPVLSYDFGRDEDSGDTNDLLGLGDIDGTIELGGFVAYEADRFSAKLEIRQGVDGGHDGITGEAEIAYRGTFNAFARPAFFTVGPAVSFGDTAFNSAFFDVDAAQSAASGISQFDAGGGINSYGLHAMAVVPLSDKTALVGFVEYDQLSGDVGGSSIVNERGSKAQTTAGIFITYSF